MKLMGCLIPVVLILAVVLVTIGMPFATIPEGYTGIVIRFGEAQKDTLSAGFHAKPLFSKVVKMDNRWQKYSTTTSAFSKDIQQVDVAVSMSYQISNTGALRLYKEVGLDYADKIMLPRLLDAMKSTFAKYSAEELVSNREKISGEVLALLSNQLEFYALEVREVAIEDIDFTDAFTNAIEAKQVATQKKLQVETEQEQQNLVAKAEAERAKIKAQAEAEEKMIQAKAEADAVKIAADAEAYRLEMESKFITDDVIRKETIEKWDGKLPAITGTNTMPLIDAKNIGQ